MKRLFCILLLSATISIILESFVLKSSEKTTSEKIHWYTFQEAVELNKKNPKKLYIDVYTDWCGWCKKMDASTFTNPVIIKDMNKYYYAVRLNAEMKDTIVFQNHTFVNQQPNIERSVHDLASALLNGQMGYPTAVYMDENYAIISPMPGYQTPEALEPILVFIGENKSQENKYEDFLKTFKSEIK